MKKPGLLEIAGSTLLFACMVFAIARLESADAWIALWIPFVIAGVGMAFFGTVFRLTSRRSPGEAQHGHLEK